MALVPGNPGGSAGGHYHTFYDPSNRHDPSGEFLALYGLGGSLLVGGPVLGKIARPAGGWVLKQLGKPVLKGFRNPFAAYESVSSTYTWADRALLGAKIHQIVDGSSSQGLVQNGGPSAPLPLAQRGQLSDVLSLGKTIKIRQSAHGRSSRTSATAGGKRRRSYPMGEAFFEWDVNGRSYNPCAQGYVPRKIKGRWHCVRKKR